VLFISRKAAWRAAVKAMARGVADRFKIEYRLKGAADRSCDAGYMVALFKGGRFVGYA